MAHFERGDRVRIRRGVYACCAGEVAWQHGRYVLVDVDGGPYNAPFLREDVEPIVQTITAPGHPYSDGDVFSQYTSRERTRLQVALRLLKRPRLYVARNCTPTQFEIVERRMNWAEWRAAWARLLFS